MRRAAFLFVAEVGVACIAVFLFLTLRILQLNNRKDFFERELPIKTMDKLYYNLHLLNDEEGSVATTENEHNFGEYFDLVKCTELMYSFTIEEGIVQDYLANDLGWPLMSERMKIIFEKFISKGIHWVKAKVYDKRLSKNYSYYILVFHSKIDVVNVKESSYDNTGLILVPVFSLSKINEIDFFPQPDEYDFNIAISEGIRSALESAEITGIDFSKALLSK